MSSFRKIFITVLSVAFETAIKTCLSSERKLELQAAIEMAQGMEAAEAGTKELQKQTQPLEPVAAVDRIACSESTVSGGPKNMKLGQKCFHCGSTLHLANACKFAKSKCFLGRKTGQLKNICRSKSAETGVKKPGAV